MYLIHMLLFVTPINLRGEVYSRLENTSQYEYIDILGYPKQVFRCQVTLPINWDTDMCFKATYIYILVSLFNEFFCKRSLDVILTLSTLCLTTIFFYIIPKYINKIVYVF